MPKISQKGIAMPESPIRKLVPFAENAKKSGKRVYHLNIGQPDIHTPKIALDAISSFSNSVVEYSHSAGFESYRKGLSKYYQNIDINVSHSDLLITTGGSEALLFALNSCLDDGDEIIIPEPFYANYNGFSISSGVKVVPIATNIDDGFALPSIQEFEKLITSRTKAILICNPGNPTGYLYSKAELESLKEIVVKNNLFLIADEVYREFAYDGEKHHSVLNISGIENHAIVIDSTSKRYSMCGIRVGCIVSKNKDVISTALKFAQARLSPPTFGQIAGEAALCTPQSYFDKVSKEYVGRRNVLVNGLNSIEGVICPKPKGAFYAIAQLPVDNADEFAKWLLEEFSFEGETIMVAPAAGFYSTINSGFNQVRIAYVLNKDSLKKAVQILKEALKVYPGRVV
ncbi:MAG: pyridoxal phosphate-dependent aminotransferase [Flavobacteriales bacterium]|nr:pyridoxal phosphate-dependent aminotransferase [Flavobacteriales bacterium]MBT6882355.1 pyridoxal phosphate-dependent aminotransferase [Flavobacterium sp.]